MCNPLEVQSYQCVEGKSVISAAQYFRDEDDGRLLMEIEPLYEYPFPEQLSLYALRCNGYKGNIHEIDKEQTSVANLEKVSQKFTLQELEERARVFS